MKIRQAQPAQLGRPEPSRVERFDYEPVPGVRAGIDQGAHLIAGQRGRRALHPQAADPAPGHHRPAAALPGVERGGR